LSPWGPWGLTWNRWVLAATLVATGSLGLPEASFAHPHVWATVRSEIIFGPGRGGGAWANAVWTTCALGGSALILLFGATLFAASLGPARPF